jgi:hypothetical protein
LLQVVRVRAGIPVDELSFECTIDQDGELAVLANAEMRPRPNV